VINSGVLVAGISVGVKEGIAVGEGSGVAEEGSCIGATGVVVLDGATVSGGNRVVAGFNIGSAKGAWEIARVHATRSRDRRMAMMRGMVRVDDV
jgi:hypothetical protein